MAFEARYEGRCADCGEPFRMGDLIEHAEPASADDFRAIGRYAHADCDSVEPEATQLDRDAQREVCTTCWLLKPCPCEDGA